MYAKVKLNINRSVTKYACSVVFSFAHTEPICFILNDCIYTQQSYLKIITFECIIYKLPYRRIFQTLCDLSQVTVLHSRPSLCKHNAVITGVCYQYYSPVCVVSG